MFPEARSWNQPVEIMRRKLRVQREFFFVGVVDDTVVGTALAGYESLGFAVEPRISMGKVLASGATSPG